MSRTRLLIAGAVAIAIGLVVALVAAGGRAKDAAPGRAGATRTGPRPGAIEPRTVDTLPAMALQYDDDPPGDQRLEGQVIDVDEQPVGGALVVVDANPPREVETEEDGSFAFEGLVQRTYQLQARGGDAVAGPVAVRLSAGSEPIVLRLRPAARITVDVTGDGDAPIAGALVELRDLAPVSVTTDPKGRAVLNGVAGGWHVVKASAAGRAAAYQEVTSTGEAGADTHVTFRLRAGVTVAGTVVDAAGAPVEGARVLPEGVARLDDLHDARLDAVVTDAKGRWRLTGLPRETLRLHAYHPSYAPGLTPPLLLGDGVDRDGLTIALERGARLRGRVVTTMGAPVPGAELRVAGESPRAGLVRRAACDGAGRFEVAGLPRRTVHVVAITDGATSAVTSVDLAQGDADEVELRVDQVGTVAGTVVTAAGAAVAEARVVAEPVLADDPLERLRLRLRGVASAIADGDGRFRFTGLEAGRYHVRAIPPGAPSERLEMGGGTTVATGTEDARIVIDELATVTGRVAFVDGGRPATFSIAIGGATPRWFSAPDGTFRLEGVPAGAQYLFVDGPDLVSTSRTDVAIDGPTTDLGTITVQRGRTISGVVVDGNGAAVAGATVVVARQLDGDGTDLVAYPRSGIEQAVTGADGRFTIRGIVAGIVTVVADHDTAGRSQAIEVGAGAGDVTLRLVVGPTGAMQGFVRLDGQPADAVITVLSRAAANARFHVHTGPDGSYRFDRLAPGRYMAAAGLTRGTRFSGENASIRPAEIVAGKTIDVDFDEVSTGLTIVVRITSPGDVVEYGYGIVAQLPPGITFPMPHTVAEARTLLAQYELGGVEREGLIVKNRSIEMPAVPAGHTAVCAMALRGDPSTPGVMQEVQDHTVDWPIHCKILDLPASPPRHEVVVEVSPLPPR